MKLCSTNHDEVCFDDRTACPVCAMRDEMEDQLSSLEAQKDREIAALEDEINGLESDLAEAKSVTE